MAILKIVEDTDEMIRKKSREVPEITPRIITLLDDMLETLHDSRGVGLAAVQVGVLRRVIIVEYEDGHPIELINPVIIKKEGEQEGLEGCLSVPDRWGVTIRPKKVTVKALDRNGKEFTLTAEDLGAKALCHECDHLEGILFTDIAERMLTEEEMEELN